MNLYDWASKWGIPQEAIKELMIGTNGQGVRSPESITTTESGAQQEVRLEASQKGRLLWRNNVGAGKLANGRFVRWGLANESAQMNQRIKSSDLIGIEPVIITESMVGMIIGRFIAREIKGPGWTFTGKGGENEQLAFINLVNAVGGNACFATGKGTL